MCDLILTKVRPCTVPDGRYAFELVCSVPPKTFTLLAHSAEERKAWLHALTQGAEEALGRARQHRSPVAGAANGAAAPSTTATTSGVASDTAPTVLTRSSSGNAAAPRGAQGRGPPLPPVPSRAHVRALQTMRHVPRWSD